MKRSSILLISSLLLLSGCAKGVEVTKEDALEVALDAAGYVESEVSNPSVKEENGGFAISFTSEEGQFEFTIGSDGIIQSRQFTMDKDASKKQNTESKAEDAASDKDETEAEVDESGTVGSQVALENALLNAGLAESDVADVNVTLSEDRTTFTVEFNYNGFLNVSTVDAATGTVLSTQIG